MENSIEAMINTPMHSYLLVAAAIYTALIAYSLTIGLINYIRTILMPMVKFIDWKMTPKSQLDLNLLTGKAHHTKALSNQMSVDIQQSDLNINMERLNVLTK